MAMEPQAAPQPTRACRRLAAVMQSLTPAQSPWSAAPAAAALAGPRVAVVTGANKGVGLEIARGLASLPGWCV
jgi:hypothetical protein